MKKANMILCKEEDVAGTLVVIIENLASDLTPMAVLLT